MKKVIIILLILVYGLSSSGMSISLHYCCGKLDDISFSGSQKDSCEMGNHVQKAGCCENKQISANLTSDQQAAVKWVQLVKQTIDAPESSSGHTSFKDHIVSTNRLSRGTLEDPLPVPLFVQYCVFRI